MFRMPFALIFAALALMLTSFPALAKNDSCGDWVEMKPYITDFHQIEQPQLDFLVRNFNAAQPQTDLHPQIVGYTWMTGWDLVQLIMFEDGCLVLDQPYPRLTIWGMMRAYPAATEAFDKSAKPYIAQVEAYRAREDANFERARKWRAESGLDVGDEETGMPTLGEDYGELD